MSGSVAILEARRRSSGGLCVTAVAILKSFLAVSALLLLSGCRDAPANRFGQQAQKRAKTNVLNFRNSLDTYRHDENAALILRFRV